MTGRKYALCLLLIVLLGFTLRALGIWWGQGFSYVTYGDEVEAYAAAVAFGHGDARAAYLGQPNFNTHAKLPGPLWTLFWFTALRVGRSPQAVAWAMLLLNTAVIGMVAALARRLFGQERALIAALFAATLPSMVFFSVGAYNPEVMAFIAAAVYLALWDATRRERSPHIFWVPLLVFASAQFHLSGLELIPGVVVVLWLMPTRVNKTWLAAGLAAGAVLYAPYVAGEWASGWQNTRGMLAGEQGFAFGVFKVLTIPASLLMAWERRAAGEIFDFVDLGRAAFGSFVLMVALLTMCSAMALLFVGSFVQDVREAVRGLWRRPREAFRRSPALMFVAVLLAGPLCGHLLTGLDYAGRYGILLLPLLVLVPALFVAGRMRRWRRAPILGAVTALTVAVNVFFVAGFYRYQGDKIDRGPAFLPSFAHLDALYRTIKADAGPNDRVAVDGTQLMASVTNEPPRDEVRRLLNHRFAWKRDWPPLYDTRVIPFYMDTRENDLYGTPEVRPSPDRHYELMAEGQAGQAVAKVVWRGQGIAVVAQPEADRPSSRRRSPAERRLRERLQRWQHSMGS